MGKPPKFFLTVNRVAPKNQNKFEIKNNSEKLRKQCLFGTDGQLVL